MCRTALPLTCVLMAWSSPPAVGQEVDQPKTVVIQGNEWEVWPEEHLRARGLDVPDIPYQQNAAWVYLEAMNAMTMPPAELNEAFDAAVQGKWPEGENGQKLGDWLEANKPALDLVRRASAMPDHYMPLFRSKDGPDILVAALLPPLGPHRQLAKMLAVEATYHQSQGRFDAAIDDCLTIERMGHQVANGLTLIQGLVGSAETSVAAQGLMRIAQSGQADTQVLTRAAAELQRLEDSFPDFERMIRAEEKWAGSAIDDFIEIPGAMGFLGGGFSVGEGRSPQPTGWTKLKNRLKRLYLPDRVVKANFHRHYEALAKAGRQQEDGTFGPPLEEDKLFQQIPPWDVFSRMMLPSLSRACDLMLMARSNFVRTRLTLATEAYRKEQGQYPPTLAALVPTYAPSIPIDPMTGYDFEYRVTGGDKGGYAGLERVTRENEAELAKKRRTPAILSPRASKWHRHVQSACERYRFTDAQRASADAILREMEARAAQYEQAQGAKLQQLIKELDEQKADAAKSAELDRRMGPLNKMFEELKRRLETIPTAQQRAAGQARGTTRKNK